jgi:hypothetical protein
MRADAIFDHAIVDVLQGVLEGARDVHIVGSLSEGARQRLAASIAGILSTADRSGGPPASCDAVVVLDVDRLAEAETAVGPGGR